MRDNKNSAGTANPYTTGAPYAFTSIDETRWGKANFKPRHKTSFWKKERS